MYFELYPFFQGENNNILSVRSFTLIYIGDMVPLRVMFIRKDTVDKYASNLDTFKLSEFIAVEKHFIAKMDSKDKHTKEYANLKRKDFKLYLAVLEISWKFTLKPPSNRAPGQLKKKCSIQETDNESKY
ncbi:hypothetical protein BDF21DRAFT_394788 [Thamnidium elegans]|nr:hypothetical protein BDF21DRAFT_394788 [Thamnidium elegans]